MTVEDFPGRNPGGRVCDVTADSWSESTERRRGPDCRLGASPDCCEWPTPNTERSAVGGKLNQETESACGVHLSLDAVAARSSGAQGLSPEGRFGSGADGANARDCARPNRHARASILWR